MPAVQKLGDGSYGGGRTNTRREADGVTTRARSYPGAPYWETETPRVVDSGKLRFSYFTAAGKLQISQLFTDRDSGELRRGRTVTIDQEDMQLHPEALALFAEVLAAWRE